MSAGQYFVDPFLNNIQKSADQLKVLKGKSRSEINNYEYEKLLASYYLIEICSGYEQALKSLFLARVGQANVTSALSNYIKDSKFLPSANFNDICNLLERLDGRSKSLFKSRVHDLERDALSSLYQNRQRIVHYSESRSVNITFNEVEHWHKKSLRLIKKFETVLKRFV